MVILGKLSTPQCLKYHAIYTKFIRSMFQQNFPPWIKNLSWCLVIAVHMFSCYLHMKIPEEGGIVPCYVHRRYRSILKKIFPMVKVTMVFLSQLSDVRCVYYHLFTHKLSGIFSHCLPQWLKLPRCLYLNYQVYGVNVIVLFIEITRGRGSANFFPMIKVTTMLSPKLSRLQCL